MFNEPVSAVNALSDLLMRHGRLGVVRMTVRTASIKQSVTYEWNKNGTQWHSMATFGEVFSAISLGPEPIRIGAFSGMGGTEVARAQSTNMPSLVSVDSACPYPTSGQGSGVSNRPTDRGNHASTVPSSGRASVGHYQPSRWDTWCAPHALTRYLLQCCVFQKTLTQTLQFGGKNGLSR